MNCSKIPSINNADYLFRNQQSRDGNCRTKMFNQRLIQGRLSRKAGCNVGRLDQSTFNTGVCGTIRTQVTKFTVRMSGRIISNVRSASQKTCIQSK